MAISSELLDITIDGAHGILFNVTGGDSLTLFEVNQAAAIIKETAHPDVNLIFGAVIDPSMGDEIRLTVIATGFDSTSMHARSSAPASRRLEQRNQRSRTNQKIRRIQSGAAWRNSARSFTTLTRSKFPPFCASMQNKN